MKWWTSLSTPIRFGCVMAWPMLLFVAAPAAAPAQDVAKPAAGVQPGSPFGPGAIVVLKSAGAPLSDAGRLVPSQDCLVFLIERTQGDLILLASSDNSVRGWLHPDHVVPLDKAVGYFAEVIAGDRRNAEAHWMRGRVLYYLNDDRRALVNLNQAIRLKPDQARFYLTRSLVYFRTDKIDRAMEDCDKAIQLEPKSPRGYQFRAYAWLRKKDQDRASADLGQALRLDPMNLVGPPGAVPAGDDAHDDDADGTGESTTPGGTAARPEPATAAQFVDRGNEWLAQERFDRAMADYNAAIRLDPKYAPAFAARARTWAKKHYREKEIADCSEAIRLEPNNATYWLTRAESWSAQGLHPQRHGRLRRSPQARAQQTRNLGLTRYRMAQGTEARSGDR